MSAAGSYHEYSSEGEYWGEDETDGAGVSPDSILLSLVQSYNWAGALARISAFPAECKAVGEQGRTPLHVACDHDAPAVVVEKLVRAYPEATLMVGTSNMNPLHITCSSQNASAQVVKVLLDAGHELQSSMRDLDGDTPLHAACRCGAPLEVLELLIEANPSVVNQRDYEGLTPLLRLWVRYFVILGDDVIDTVTGPSGLHGNLEEAWNRTVLLLKASNLGSLDESKHAIGYKFRAVHAAAAVDCPRPIVRLSTLIHPELLSEKDEKGRTPLSIAAQTEIFKVRDLTDEGYMLEDRIHGDDTFNDTENDDGPDSSSQPSVIDILLEAKPEAASIPDNQGRLPLHLAISSGKTWSQGVKAILKANPDTLTSPDPTTGLQPFLQAASSSNPDLGTILELLKKDPSMAKEAITRRGSGSSEECIVQREQPHVALRGLEL